MRQRVDVFNRALLSDALQLSVVERDEGEIRWRRLLALRAAAVVDQSLQARVEALGQRSEQRLFEVAVAGPGHTKLSGQHSCIDIDDVTSSSLGRLQRAIALAGRTADEAGIKAVEL